jgi:REP element-mobilizing transposase RayT
MLRGNERKSIFGDNEEKHGFLEGMRIKKKELGFSVYSYCIMDNHVHIALNSEESDISGIMKGIGVRYAFFYNTRHQRVGHVFQDRFKSEPVENDRYLLALVRYIHNNPVKAGIVSGPEEYYWSSYSAYLQQEPINAETVDTSFVLGMIGHERESAIKEFERFSNEPDETKFLEFNEDKNEKRSLAEGRIFFTNYLESEWMGRQWSEIKKDPKSRQEIIRHIRNQTRLSVRAIAELLGISKNIVH